VRETSGSFFVPIETEQFIAIPIISQICEQFYTFEERQMKKGEKT